jgi:DNA replication protein DnaC
MKNSIRDHLNNFKVTKEVNSTFEKTNTPTEYKQQLWTLFLKNFKELHGISFCQDDDAKENLKPIFTYLLRDSSFFESCNLISDLSKPSFNKGLLIIGGFGTGKTSIMKTMQQCSLLFMPQHYKILSCNEVVQKYESSATQLDKKEFFRQMNAGTNLFDDLASERLASNYGQVNIMKDVLEQRYFLGKITHATMNFKEGYPGDVEMALKKLGEFYGPRIYDRIFEMFNVIIFKGKSRRV